MEGRAPTISIVRNSTINRMGISDDARKSQAKKRSPVLVRRRGRGRSAKSGAESRALRFIAAIASVMGSLRTEHVRIRGRRLSFAVLSASLHRSQRALNLRLQRFGQW